MYKCFSLYSILIFFNIYIFAQTACFTTTDSVGCLPHTVTLVDCSGAPAVVYIYEENGEKDTTTTNTYTYSTGGKHTITQLINTSGGIESLTKKDYIKTINRPKPDFSLAACEGYNVLIKIKTDDYQKYIISYDDGSENDTVLPYSSTIKTFNDITLKSITVQGYYENFDCSNVNTKIVLPIISLEEPQLISLVVSKVNDEHNAILSFNTNPLLEYYYEEKKPTEAYTIIDSIQPNSTSTLVTINDISSLSNCYRSSSFDRCQNKLTSEEICTVQVSVSPLNNQNEISWNEYELPNQVNEYELLKDQNLVVSTIDSRYTDSVVHCGTVYCYQTVAKLNYTNTISGELMTSTSQIECIQAISSDTPPAVTNLQSTFSNDSLSIHWSTPSRAPVDTFYLNENRNNAGYLLKKSFVTSDTMEQVSFFKKDLTSCYMISYTDICGNTSDSSAETCPIRLKIVSDTEDEIHEATWTNYIGYPAPTYRLIMYDRNGLLIDEIDLGNVLSHTIEWPNDENQQIVFSISTPTIHLESFSTNVTVEEGSQILIPNAFTPNNDELNDTFKPVGRFIDSYSITIFNSMGIICFVSSENQEAWSGKTNDRFVPEGTYYYEIMISDKNGIKTKKNGSVTVIY